MEALPVIPEAGTLAGDWRLSSAAGETCTLRLSTDGAELQAGSLAAPMLALEGDCAWARELSGWRPIPLGLELTDAAGFAVMSFEQAGPGVLVSSALGASLVRR